MSRRDIWGSYITNRTYHILENVEQGVGERFLTCAVRTSRLSLFEE